MKKYVGAVCAEIKNSRPMDGRVSTVFFGGGTPSAMPGEDITEIVEALRGAYDMSCVREMTIEVNPGTVSAEKLSLYKSLGFNRLSIGAQSFDDRELVLLGRIHSAAGALETFEAARRAGFSNINIDLITHLPSQRVKELENTLRIATGLGCEHISCYSLIVEEGTPFYERYGPGTPGERELPGEEESNKMDALIRGMLSESGYSRYEVSNFAKPGFECQHNLGYWQRREYRGYGLSAASLFEKDGRWQRFTGEKNLADYLEDASKELTERNRAAERLWDLAEKDAMSEFMFLGLRCISGVSKEEFEKCFDTPLMAVFGNILEKQLSQGFLNCYDKEGETFYAFSEAGMDVSNVLLADYLL